MINNINPELTQAIAQLSEAIEVVNSKPQSYQLNKGYRTLSSKSFSFNETVYTMLCNLCGQEFEANRGHALWCSNACRTRAHREKRKAQRFIDANIFVIGLLFLLIAFIDLSTKTLQKRSH